MRTISKSRDEPAAAVSTLDLEILRTTLISYTRELGTALVNTVPTFDASRSRAFAVAITDEQGGVVAIDNPLQLGSIAATVKHASSYFEFDLNDGDIILTNHPYRGGTKIQDMTLIAPVFMNGEPLLNLAARIRINDMGGQLGGNLYPGATELLAEGVPVTPIRIQRFGRPVLDIVATVLLNGRRPEETRRGLRAATAALELGQRKIAELTGRHEPRMIKAALRYAQDYSERLARVVMHKWRPGTYRGARALDLDEAAGGPVAVRLTATVSDKGLTLDFGESDAQRSLFINSPIGSTTNCAISAILTILGDSVPANSGLFGAIEIRTRSGTVVDPEEPAPVGWGESHCGSEIANVVSETVGPAAGAALAHVASPRSLVLSRTVSDRSLQTDLSCWTMGGSGAQEDRDGWGQPLLNGYTLCPSVEQWEAENNLNVERIEYVENSAGAGQWAGAPCVEVVITLDPDRLYTLWTVAADIIVGGLEGGRAGAPGAVVLHGAGGWMRAPALANEERLGVDRLRLRSAGGGGYGDPAKRDRAAVLADKEDGLISAQAARDIYNLDER